MARIALLLGAGVSAAGGMPTTQELTDLVLRCPGVVRHTDGTFYLEQGTHHVDAKVSEARELLRVVHEEAFEGRAGVTYEDLYYVAAQIRDARTFNYDNEAVGPLVTAVDGRLPKAWGTGYRSGMLGEATREACNLIADVVAYALQNPTLLASPSAGSSRKTASTSLSHLDLLGEIARTRRHMGVDVFTLNHDCLIEQYLGGLGLDFSDGFGRWKRGIEVWRRRAYSASPGSINVIKLHGSVDWFMVRVGHRETVARLARGGSAGGSEGWLRDDPHPLMLIGRFNKMLEYSQGCFFELHALLRRRLAGADELIVAGYSFSDKGINTALIEWVCSSRRPKRLRVIHPRPARLREKARRAISAKWGQWEEEGMLVLVPMGFERASLKDLRL